MAGPTLPPRPGRARPPSASSAHRPQLSETGGVAQPGPSESERHATALSSISEMAAKIQASPGVQKLLANPELVQTALQSDPTLGALVQQNPDLASLLNPDKLQSMMQSLSNPSSLVQPGQSAGLLPGDSDLSLHRKTLLELQHYSQNLQRRAMQDAGPSSSAAALPQGPGSGTAAGDVAGMSIEQRMARSQERLAQMLQFSSAIKNRGTGPGPGRWSDSGRGPLEAANPAQPSLRKCAEPSFEGWTSPSIHTHSHTDTLPSSQPNTQPALSPRPPLPPARPPQQSDSAAGPGSVRPMHAPMQHEPLYSGLPSREVTASNGQSDTDNYQGSFTFTYSEREIPLHELSPQVRAQLRGETCAHPPADAPATAAGGGVGSEEAKARYARLYEAYMQSMRGGGGAGGVGGGVGDANGAGGVAASEMWAAYYQAYPEAAQGSAPGATNGAQGSNGTTVPRASHYYETVTPSDWRPDTQDDCIELHRRAYCSKADAVWPPVWLCLCLLAAAHTSTPFPLLLLLAAGLFVMGMAVSAIYLAGCLEVAIWVVALGWVLPGYSPRWGLSSCVLALSLTSLPIVHYLCHIADPGFVTPDKPTTDTHTDHNTSTRAKPFTSSKTKSTARMGHNGKINTGTNGYRTVSSDDEDETVVITAGALPVSTPANGAAVVGVAESDERAPLLPAAAGGNGVAGGMAGGDGSGARLDLNTCVTCKVARPLRSKHCPVCNKCVDRFDHHCPAVLNCIGSGNQRHFALYLLNMATAQLAWLTVGCAYLQQQYAHEARAAGGAEAAAAADAGWVSGAALAHAAVAHRCVLFLLCVQAPLAVFGVLLALRQLFCITANITINELINRKRYQYLNHEVAGYCNRFDRGAGHNCIQFWLEPHQNWLELFEQGDREMVYKRETLLSLWSPGITLRAMDIVAAKRVARARQARERGLAAQLQAQAGGTLSADQLKRLVGEAMAQGDEERACCPPGGHGAHGHHHHHHH